MKVQYNISTSSALLLPLIIVCLTSIESCGLEDDGPVGPQSSGNPYGHTIAYGANTGTEGLALINPDGSQRRVVGADDSITSLTWSPDKRTVAYVKQKEFLIGHMLRVAMADGSGIVTLAEGVRATDLSPGCWSPDGVRLVFEGGPNNMIVIKAATGALDFFVPGAMGGSFVSDSVVVCQLLQDTHADSTIIVQFNISSGAMLELADDSGGTYFLPRVHLAGEKVAYVFAPSGDPDNTNEIWIMNIDGSGKQRLATGGTEYLEGRIRELRFSPDGSRLLFVPDWGALTRLHVLDIGTGDELVLIIKP